MITLAEHLSSTGETQSSFAARVGARTATVSGWVNGVIPRPEFMARIEKATNGAVPIAVWFTDHATPDSPAKAPRSGVVKARASAPEAGA